MAFSWSKLSFLGRGFGKLLLIVSLMLAVSSLGFYFFELRPQGKTDFFSAIWWSVVTLTTVGYGDLVPASIPGRILGLMVMVSGIGVVSTLSGNLASLLVERQARKRKGLMHVKLSGHVLILGWNAYAERLVLSLLSGIRNANVVLVNQLPQAERDELAYRFASRVPEHAEHVHFVVGDPTLQNVLVRANPEQARVVYVMSQEGLEPKDADQQAIYATLTLRDMNPKVPIYGEVVIPDNREHLLRAGVNEIIVRGELATSILGLMGATPSVWPFLQRLLGLGQSDEGKLSYRRLTPEEKRRNWKEIAGRMREKEGGLALALCQESKSLSLEDMLDEGSALDQFILELFAASGQSSQLGDQGPNVVINPSDQHAADHFDGVLYLSGKGLAHA